MYAISRVVFLSVAWASFVTWANAAEREKVVGANWSQARKFSSDFVNQHVTVASIAPTFIGKTDLFWYAIRTPEGMKYWKVDPAKKRRTPLFDHVKLLALLSEQAQKPLDAVTYLIRAVKVSDDELKMTFAFETTQYEYDLTANTIKKLGKAAPEPPTMPMTERMNDDERKEQEKKDEEKPPQIDVKKTVATALDYKVISPDKQKYLYAFKYNLYLAEEGKEKDAKQLTTDGEEDYGFGISSQLRRNDGTVEKPQPVSERKSRPIVTWSKDSKRFTVTRTDRRGLKELFLVDSIAEPRPALERYRYAMPGEPAISKGELYIGNAEAKTLTQVKSKWKDESFSEVRFGKSSDEVEFIRRDRLRRHLEYCRLNVKTGEEKCLISEGFEAAYVGMQPPRWVPETDEILWWSERSGWGHFYLYDRDGKLKNTITSGSWRASRIVEVDAANRLIYLLGNAREAGENVYYSQLYRVRFDGSELTNLTPGNANHRPFLSPSKRFVVDTYSRTDLAHAATLRDDKGNVVMELETTDLTRLEKTGWKMPECFDVKAADGMTDLYGNMWKPFDFDVQKKYPIIVYVYPGPQQEGVSHTFTAWSRYQQLAQLGFIVIQVGHRGGCPERSKAYHSYGYFNLRDFGLADKKAAIEALAGRHPWIDIDRVGIFGHSGGGFMSGAAMLQKPYNEFFKAAVASAGNHDNNIYNSSWSETYHGLKEVPVEEKKETTTQGTRKSSTSKPEGKAELLPPPRTVTQTKETPKTKFDIHIPTNAELAANLKGHLMLVHGEIDNNVHPANTMRLVDALIKANKRFDLLIIPGARHGFGSATPYFTDRMWDFFAEHLLDDRQTRADIKDRTDRPNHRP